MKILTFIFWKATRARLEKDGYSVTYNKALLFCGLLFVIIPLILFRTAYNIDIGKFTHLSKALQYLIAIPIVCVVAIPFWFIFPKEKIKNLTYSDEEKKNYNRKLLYFCFFVLFLIVSRIVYMKVFK